MLSNFPKNATFYLSKNVTLRFTQKCPPPPFFPKFCFYVGRDQLTSGAIFMHDGQPLIQCHDMVNDEYDRIHHTEIKAIHKMFEAKKFADKIEIAETSFTVEQSDPELYVQGKDEAGGTWTVFHTHKTVMIGYSDVEECNPRECYLGMSRVADFFLMNSY